MTVRCATRGSFGDRALLRDRDGVSLLADLSHLRVGVADDAALASRLRAAGVDVAAIDTALRSRLGSFARCLRSVELPDGTEHDRARRAG